MCSLAVDDLTVYPFKNLNLLFPSNTFTMIAGSNQSGKTMLIRVMSGLVVTKKMVRINRTYLEELSSYERSKKIGVFLGGEEWYFLFKTVEEELRFPLENLRYEKDVIDQLVKNIASDFHLNAILKLNPNHLSKFLKVKVLLALEVITKPELLLLDDPTKMLTKKEAAEVIRILNKQQSLGMTIIMTTSNLNDVLEAKTSKLYLLHQGKIVLEGAPFVVLNEDSLINKIGLRLPFMVDLCVKLKYYNLIDTIDLNPESLVNHLWK